MSIGPGSARHPCGRAGGLGCAFPRDPRLGGFVAAPKVELGGSSVQEGTSVCNSTTCDNTDTDIDVRRYSGEIKFLSNCCQKRFVRLWPKGTPYQTQSA